MNLAVWAVLWEQLWHSGSIQERKVGFAFIFSVRAALIWDQTVQTSSAVKQECLTLVVKQDVRQGIRNDK